MKAFLLVIKNIKFHDSVLTLHGLPNSLVTALDNLDIFSSKCYMYGVQINCLKTKIR